METKVQSGVLWTWVNVSSWKISLSLHIMITITLISQNHILSAGTKLLVMIEASVRDHAL